MIPFLFGTAQYIKDSLRACVSFFHNGETCIVCNKKTLYIPICKKCLEELYLGPDLFSTRRCSLCGKYLISEKELCMVCREKSVFCYTDYVFPLWEYRLWNKELLFRWKIQSERSLSAVFARKVSETVLKLSEKNGFKNGTWALIPVPPRKGKIKKKGWDQIEELSRFLECRYGIKVLRILQRNTVSEQKKLDRNERIKTIGKSYSLLPSDLLQHELKKNGGTMPDAVILLDDILTTGSTIESCAEVLKKGGVQRVEAVTLFTAS